MKVTRCLYCESASLSEVAQRSDSIAILECADCQLMMVAELPEDIDALYAADYFEKGQDTNIGYADYLTRPAADLIGKYGFARLFRSKPGSYLDLGCADGSLMEIFREAGFEARGLEISADVVKIAKSKGLDVRRSNLHGFPAKLQPSDLVTAFDLLEHSDRPGVVLRAVRDNLDRGGVFVFSTLAVKKRTTSEYWFNNSLEHFSYFTDESLRHILTDIFGEGNFAFVEVVTNGAAEFWGFARKTATAHDAAVMATIKQEGFNESAVDESYHLALFYDQIARPAASRRILSHFDAVWPPALAAQAQFYHHYLRGELAAALRVAAERGRYVPLGRSVFWQALAYAEKSYASIRQQHIAGEYDAEIVRLRAEMESSQKTYADEIVELRSQLFRVRDELHSLKNSRVVGRVIKARNITGDSVRKAIPVVKSAPRKGVHKTRKMVAKVLPPPLSRAIMRGLRGAKRRIEASRQRSVNYVTVPSHAWPVGAPLVSVIIPYYNRADTIDDTLDSLRAQTFRNFETIIVNDGSPDQASVDKLKHIPAGVPGLRVIHQQNQGVAVARNTGIAAAAGKYVICLDSDDLLDPTFIEKAVVVMETTPDVSLITSHQDMFGVISELFQKSPYHPLHLYEDNMVITAAAFRKQAWQASGGYKPKIGYEDWEFWLSLAEHGFWGKLIPEPLFRYRTSIQSRYVDDKDVHWKNVATIHSLHPRYKTTVRNLRAKRAHTRHIVEPTKALVNLADRKHYARPAAGRPNVLIAIPWMTFGGAETLIYNFCRQIKSDFNISFVTGLKSDNEWEYKFREITPNIFHMANLFEGESELYLEFVSNYIETRQIDVLHIIHNGFMFEMLPELKRRHPRLRVAITTFNDLAPYCEQSIGYEQYIDIYTSDNQAVGNKYLSRLQPGADVRVIPNGIDCFKEFNPALFDRQAERVALGLQEDDLAVYFVGRLSEEKNPDVFVEAAKKVIRTNKRQNVKFFVIGDGPMNGQITGAIKQLNSPALTYLGYRPSAEVAKLLSAADVFVLPSKAEGFPLSILEAMAMRLVVVASRVGAIPDVIKHGKMGYIVTPGSAAEIVEAIKALGNDRHMVDTAKALARKDAEAKYSLAALGANYSELYNISRD